MPSGTSDTARHSIGGALAAAHGDAELVRTAREAFTGAMSTTFMVSAVGVVAAAVLAAVVMRDGKGEPTPEAQEEPPARELAA
ncbi:hypothetical protein [Streptomyces sp. NPDC001642]|uniref:hypothetical protein n=1 Tax=Streptomyces sp. NPDC001642 TaxID=3154392 RepID=UPI003330C0E2